MEIRKPVYVFADYTPLEQKKNKKLRNQLNKMNKNGKNYAIKKWHNSVEENIIIIIIHKI